MMAKLEELEEELYGKDDEDLKRRMKKRVIFPGTLKKPPVSWLDQLPFKKKEEKGQSNFLKYFLSGLIILFIVGIAAFVFFYLGSRGQEAQVTIEGRDRVEAGEVLTVPIVFKNTSRTALKEAEVAITLPGDSLVNQNGNFIKPSPRLTEKVDDLGPGAEEHVDVTVKLFGHENEEKTVEAALLYRPENLGARFSVKTSKVFTIARVPLAISWEIPTNLSKGQEVEVKVHYVSSASSAFDNLTLRLDYPPGFNFESAQPPPDIGNNIWRIGILESGKEGLITLRGTISGEEGDTKAFQAGLGSFNELTKEWLPYTESSQETKIAVTPLAVEGFIDGAKEKNIIPGETLNLSLRYKNNTQSVLQNITVRAFISGDILSLDTLNINNGGTYDYRSGAVIWSPGSTASLSKIDPGAGGELTFSVKAKDRPVVRSAADKNLAVNLRSTIEAGGVPQELAGTKVSSGEALTFKVQSRVLFSAKVLYRTSPLPNFGPLPPRVGQKTAYTVVWEVRNFTNNLENATVETSLPPNIKWENAFYPSGASFIFDPASGKVRWQIGELKAGTGVLTPALSSAFQVSITPSQADVGKSVTLANESDFTAQDSFTNDNLTQNAAALSTQLSDDPTTSTNDWSVVR